MGADVPARDALRNCGPFVATLAMKLEEEGVFVWAPMGMWNSGFEVIMVTG